jgi:hypothetical protein
MPHERQSGDDGSRVVVDTDKSAINIFSPDNNQNNANNNNSSRTYKFD